MQAVAQMRSIPLAWCLESTPYRRPIPAFEFPVCRQPIQVVDRSLLWGLSPDACIPPARPIVLFFHSPAIDERVPPIARRRALRLDLAPRRVKGTRGRARSRGCQIACVTPVQTREGRSIRPPIVAAPRVRKRVEAGPPCPIDGRGRDATNKGPRAPWTAGRALNHPPAFDPRRAIGRPADPKYCGRGHAAGRKGRSNPGQPRTPAGLGPGLRPTPPLYESDDDID